MVTCTGTEVIGHSSCGRPTEKTTVLELTSEAEAIRFRDPFSRQNPLSECIMDPLFGKRLKELDGEPSRDYHSRGRPRIHYAAGNCG